MHLICPKEALLSNLNIVSKAVSSKSTLSILECILLIADEKGFRMIANDLAIGIETSPIRTCIIEEFGSIALEARTFYEIVRKLPGDQVSIQTDKKNITKIKSDKSEFKILGQNGEEFPFLPMVEKNNEYKIKSSVFKNMIRQTIFSVSLEDTKPALTGELIEIRNDTFNIVAIDGFRISFRKTRVEEVLAPSSVIVPAKALNEVSKILQDGDDAIEIYFTDKHILFNLRECIVVSRILEGEYIKYSQIFTDDFNTLIRVDRQGLLMGIERSTLVSKESKKSPVVLNITENTMTITSSGDLGTSYDEIKVEGEGENIEISFNPKYLIDALKAIDDDVICIQFTNALSPCILRGIQSDDYKYLVLPLRLKG